MNREVICFDAVAPVRERGLKLLVYIVPYRITGRSREGARIEITVGHRQKDQDLSLP